MRPPMLLQHPRLHQLLDWSMDPDGALAFYWKALLTLAVIYNCVVIVLRTAFVEMRNESTFQWLDQASDVIYVLDMLMEAKTAFLNDGCLVEDTAATFRHYTQRSSFIYDVISVWPIYTAISSILYVASFFRKGDLILRLLTKNLPVFQPALRLNRLLKCHSMNSFFLRTESRTNTPNFLRAFKLSLHLGLVIHWIACLYYMLSEYEGLGSNEWVYPSGPNSTHFSKKYILCMFWSTMTLTTIGERPPPITEIEYIFTGFTFLIGVFVFAAVVGNVGDVISNMNAARRDFQARMDQIKFYLAHRQVPDHLQTRIKRWAEYTWDRTKAIDEPSVLQMLPDRLRTEVAIHVHLDILRKVSVFDDCEEGLLRELVLKLKSQIFSPGDYICRIGEIGRELYIINHGKVEILFPDTQTGCMRQVAVMTPGNFFGEISLLKVDDGQNKRTADVRSVGFSELLCLSRRDLMLALTEYPEAKRMLEEYAHRRFNHTKRMTTTDNEDTPSQSPSRVTSPRRSVKQVFTRVMKQEGFSRLLDGGRETDLIEIKNAVHELRQHKSAAMEGHVISLQQRAHHLEKLLLEKNLKLQEAQTRAAYLESMVAHLSSHQQPRRLTLPTSGELDASTSALDLAGFRRRTTTGLPLSLSDNGFGSATRRDSEGGTATVPIRHRNSLPGPLTTPLTSHCNDAVTGQRDCYPSSPFNQPLTTPHSLGDLPTHQAPGSPANPTTTDSVNFNGSHPLSCSLRDCRARRGAFVRRPMETLTSDDLSYEEDDDDEDDYSDTDSYDEDDSGNDPRDELIALQPCHYHRHSMFGSINQTVDQAIDQSIDSGFSQLRTSQSFFSPTELSANSLRRRRRSVSGRRASEPLVRHACSKKGHTRKESFLQQTGLDRDTQIAGTRPVHCRKPRKISENTQSAADGTTHYSLKHDTQTAGANTHSCTPRNTQVDSEPQNTVITTHTTTPPNAVNTELTHYASSTTRDTHIQPSHTSTDTRNTHLTHDTHATNTTHLDSTSPTRTAHTVDTPQTDNTHLTQTAHTNADYDARIAHEVTHKVGGPKSDQASTTLTDAEHDTHIAHEATHKVGRPKSDQTSTTTHTDAEHDTHIAHEATHKVGRPKLDQASRSTVPSAMPMPPLNQNDSQSDPEKVEILPVPGFLQKYSEIR